MLVAWIVLFYTVGRLLTYLISYLLTYLLHGAEFVLRSQPVLSKSRNSPILWKPKFEGSPPHSQFMPPVPILSQLEPYHTNKSHFLKIHINIILPSTHGSPKCSLFLRFPNQNPVYASPLLIHATCPAHLILLDFITRTKFG